MILAPEDLAILIPDLRRIVQAAGEAIMEVYNASELIPFQTKADASPVTEADLAADHIIRDHLQLLTPGIPVLTEETYNPDSDALPEQGYFWLVDPLDGTKEFLARSGEFSVNIGLVTLEEPVLGILHAPALNETQWGVVGQGATMSDPDGHEHPIFARPIPATGGTVVTSRFNERSPKVERFATAKGVTHHRQRGSALKFCDIACGRADYYPRWGLTYEWDTAAGHAIVLAAGGSVTTIDGQKLVYGKNQLKNPPFLAQGIKVDC